MAMSNYEINKALLQEEQNRINQATEPEEVLDWKEEPLQPSETYWWLNDELVSDSDLYEYLEERLGMAQYEG